jgi:hypothetical protein
MNRNDRNAFTAADLADPSQRQAAAGRFRQDGYVVIAQMLSAVELAALQLDSAEVMDDGADRHGEADWFFSPGPDGDRLHRVQYVFPKGSRRSLLCAAAHPLLLALVRELLGDDFLCAGEALVFKAAGAGREVPVHTDCDAGSPALARDHLFFNADVYLDDSEVGNGCLLAAPGSHRSGESAADIAAQGFAYPGLIPVPVRAGDVIFHDARVVHGSRSTSQGRLRRTLYYEFHNRLAIERDGYPPGSALPQGWSANRQRILHHAIARRAQMPWGAGEAAFVYRPATLPAQRGELIDLRPRLGHGNYI